MRLASNGWSRSKCLMMVGSLLSAALLCAGASSVWPAEAEGHGSGGQFWNLFWRTVNFGILILILYKLLAKPLKGYLNQRQHAIKEMLERASKAKEDAEARARQIEERLFKATQEIQEIKALLQDQGRREKDKIIETAKKEAENIKKQAQISAEQELKKAQIALRSEAVELATTLGMSLLMEKIDQKDHDRLINEYLQKVGSQQ